MRSRLCLATFVCLLLVSSAVAEDAKSELNQPPEGFVALFNGSDLSGWIGVPHFDPRKLREMSVEERQKYLDANWVEVQKHWSVDNGELVNDGFGPYLTTGEDYGDFELRLEYKTVAKADSGIYLRGAPQVQIWDTTQEGGKWDRMANKGSGGLFNNQIGPNTPLVHADKPFGEWNSMTITMIGENVTVVFNDKLVVNEVPLENYFDRSIPIFPVGPIQLQTHGGEIRFRNVFIREIPRTPPESGFLSKEGKPYGDGWNALTESNAKDAASWRDADQHVIFSIPEGKTSKFSVKSAPGDDAGTMELAISQENGVVLTHHLADGKAVPVASTPAEVSGLKSEGDQHLYVRIQGDSVQAWLNGTSVIDVLYPHGPQKGVPAIADVNVKSVFVRHAKDDPRVPMFEGGEEGFEPIFNGKDLSGWTGHVEGYRATPGVMYSKVDSGNIFTEKTYDNFHLRFEFKLDPGGNNGIGFRSPIGKNASYAGIESQILDNTSEKYNEIQAYQVHGSLYGIIPAKRGYLKAVGQWNQQEIIADGNHVKVILNGKVIVDGDLAEASANGTIDGKDHPGLKNKEGHIGLLGHGHEIGFRDMRVKSLSK